CIRTAAGAAAGTGADVLTILYEDNHCLAVAKPAPLLTQGVPPGIATLEAQVKAYLKERYHKPGNVYLGIPHRLDRPVSGVVLFARNTKAARRLAEQFQQRQVTKTYWAAVEGAVEPPEGRWEDWLLKIAAEARAERVAADTPGARHALLHYRRLGAAAGGVAGTVAGRRTLSPRTQVMDRSPLTPVPSARVRGEGRTGPGPWRFRLRGLE